MSWENCKLWDKDFGGLGNFMDDHWTQARELSCSCSFLDTGEYELKFVEVGVFILKQGLDSYLNKGGY